MKTIQGQPPPIIALGTAPAIGWAIYIILDVLLHIDDTIRLWIMFPAMLPILMLADSIGRKIKPSTGWIVGILGWIASFCAIWVYQLLKIK